MRSLTQILLLVAASGSAVAAPAPIAPPPLVRMALPAPPAPPAPLPLSAMEARASEAEALGFVKAFSPSDLRREAEVGLLQREFVLGLRREPSAAEMLDTFPTLGDALTAAMVSQIDVYIEEYDGRFFPRAVDIARQSLSRDDVLKLTAFYRSALGRKVLSSVAARLDGKEFIDRALAGKGVDAGVARRQTLRAGMATYSALAPDEKKQVLDVALSPAGRRFEAMMPQIVALQVELANQPGPKFEAGAKAAMGVAFKRVTGTDPLTK